MSVAENQTQDLGQKLTLGALWMVLLKVAERSLGLVSTIILARILVPEDFGLVVLATTLAAVFEYLTEFGFDLALIRKEQIGKADYDTVFSLSILQGLVTAAGMVAIAGVAASFYEDERIGTILYWLAVAAVLSGFSNPGTVDFRRQFRLGEEFRLLFGGKLIGFVVALSAAFVWQHYGALVAGILARRIGLTILSYLLHPYRPGWTLSKAREILSFSIYLLANNILYFARERIDKLILGKLLPTHSLGLFAVGHEIATLPTSDLVLPIGRAIYPGYTKIQSDPQRLQSGFLLVLSATLALAMPAAIGLTVLAEPFIYLVFGPAWLEAVAVVQGLAIFGLLHLFYANTEPLFIAMGRPGLNPVLNALYLIVLIPALIMIVPDYGIWGAICALIAASLMTMVLHLGLALHLLNLSPVALISQLWRIIIASLVMGSSIFLITEPVDHAWSAARLLLTGTLMGTLIYGPCLLGLWWMSGRPDGAERRLIDLAMRQPFVRRLCAGGLKEVQS